MAVNEYFPEREVLGSILSGAEIPPDIDAGMFFSPLNKVIFNALCDLKQSCTPDLMILVNHLKDARKLTAAGGRSYISDLTSVVPGPGNAGYYYEQLREKSRDRKTGAAIRRAAEDIAKGRPVDSLTPELVNELARHEQQTTRKTSWSAAELLDTEFPPVQWIVPDLVSTGLTVLAGAPKLGKSWLALALSLGIASGSHVLGKIPVEQNGVLYLALEDTGRRLQDRLRTLNAGRLDNLQFFTEWSGGTAALGAYLRQHRDIRLVIIDTWGKFGRVKDQNDYSDTTGPAAELKAVADELDIAILAVHHTRKSSKNSGGDWMDEVLGSLGLVAVADSTIVLRRRRGTSQADLLATGRDITEKELVLSFDADCGGWTVEGNKRDVQESRARQDILDWLKENGPHTPKRIHEGMKNDGEERSLSTVKTLLGKMVRDGSLVNQSGLYSALEASETPPGKQKPPDAETPAPSVAPELFQDAIPAAVTDTTEPLPAGIPPGYEEHYNSAVFTFLEYGRGPEQARREAIELVCEYAGIHNGGPP